jgi:rubrerythrin
MTFSTKEIIDIAIGIEDTGYYFYSRCADKFENPLLKETFSFLADEELRHKDFFESLEPEMKDAKGVYTTEYFQYLTAMSDGKVFSDKDNIDKAIAEITSPLDAISLALDAEKDSIFFYSELKELYESNTNTLTALNKIINEERKHVVTLLEIRDKIALTE